jgi:hypothetical protein
MLTIAWDIDDVLNELMLTWFTEVWKAEHPDSRLGYSDVSENPPDRVLGISRGDYLNSLDRFRASESARNMPPNRLVLEWLNSFGDSYRHIALTARPLESTPHAAEWLFRYADGVPLYDRDKPEYLSWLGKADILVDDSEENIRGAERLGLRGVLYPQPWNRASEPADAVLLSMTEHVREVR